MKLYNARRGHKKQFTRTAVKTKKINLNVGISRGGICL